MGGSLIYEEVLVGDLSISDLSTSPCTEAAVCSIPHAFLSTVSVPSLSLKTQKGAEKHRIEPCICVGSSADSHQLKKMFFFIFNFNNLNSQIKACRQIMNRCPAKLNVW